MDELTPSTSAGATGATVFIHSMIYSIITILKYDFIWIYMIIYGLMISYFHTFYTLLD